MSAAALTEITMRKSLTTFAVVIALTLTSSARASVGGCNPTPQVSVSFGSMLSFLHYWL